MNDSEIALSIRKIIDRMELVARPKLLKVRVVKSWRRTYWYNDKIGQVFRVYRCSDIEDFSRNNGYVLASDYDLSLKNPGVGIGLNCLDGEDCEVIE